MTLLAAGILLFVGTHLYLGLAPASVNNLRGSIGANGVKGLVSLLNIAGLTMLVLGWRATEPTWLYMPATGLRGFATLLIALGIYLFVVSQRPSALKRLLRHPQLCGVLLWAIAHLMLNGDSRSLLLFSSLGVWAAIEMLVINHRDGPWEKPPAPGVGTDIVTAVVAAVVFIALAYAHPWFAGMPAIAA